MEAGRNFDQIVRRLQLGAAQAGRVDRLGRRSGGFQHLATYDEDCRVRTQFIDGCDPIGVGRENLYPLARSKAILDGKFHQRRRFARAGRPDQRHRANRGAR